MPRKADKALQDKATGATNESIDVEMALTTALLLARSPIQTEACLIEGLNRIPVGDVSHQSLLSATISACFTPETTKSHERVGDAELGVFRLPAEPQHVLLLPAHLRRCFVLRLLVGMTRAECSRLFLMEEHDVAGNTIAANIELSRRDRLQLYGPESVRHAERDRIGTDGVMTA